MTVNHGVPGSSPGGGAKAGVDKPLRFFCFNIWIKTKSDQSQKISENESESFLRIICKIILIKQGAT